MSLRSKFCQIFGCQEYVQLKNKVDKIATDVAGMIPILVGIAGQFPVSLDASEVLEKLDTLLKPAGSIWMPHMTVDQGDVIGVPIMIMLDAVTEFGAFGFGLGSVTPPLSGFTFDETVLQFGEVLPGRDTLDWAEVSGNEIAPGSLVIGGMNGAAEPVNGAGVREIALVTFTVITSEPFEVQTSLQLDNYIDAALTYRPMPCYATITVRKPD